MLSKISYQQDVIYKLFLTMLRKTSGKSIRSYNILDVKSVCKCIKCRFFIIKNVLRLYMPSSTPSCATAVRYTDITMPCVIIDWVTHGQQTIKTQIQLFDTIGAEINDTSTMHAYLPSKHIILNGGLYYKACFSISYKISFLLCSDCKIVLLSMQIGIF